MDEQKIITLSHLKNWVDDWAATCHKNNVNPSDVPFLIEHDRREYRPFSGRISFGSNGVTVAIEYFDTDEPKTWLDYREFEPNWIQFKFSAEEFDVEKLDQMARANGDVLTETIVRMCVKGRKED